MAWKLCPGIKYQRPRWRLETAREDHRGPAFPGLRVQGSVSRAPAPAAAARDFTPSACSCWGSLPGVEGLAAEGSPFPRKVPELSAGLVPGTDWGHVALINQRLLPRMAPETAGPGDSLEWRSVQVASKPQGLSARPLRRESGVPCEPATSTLNTGIFARARARAYTHMHTPSCAPTITDFCVHTLALTVKMHGLPRAREFTYTL